MEDKKNYRVEIINVFNNAKGFEELLNKLDSEGYEMSDHENLMEHPTDGIFWMVIFKVKEVKPTRKTKEVK